MAGHRQRVAQALQVMAWLVMVLLGLRLLVLAASLGIDRAGVSPRGRVALAGVATAAFGLILFAGSAGYQAFVSYLMAGYFRAITFGEQDLSAWQWYALRFVVDTGVIVHVLLVALAYGVYRWRSCYAATET